MIPYRDIKVGLNVEHRAPGNSRYGYRGRITQFSVGGYLTVVYHYPRYFKQEYSYHDKDDSFFCQNFVMLSPGGNHIKFDNTGSTYDGKSAFARQLEMANRGGFYLLWNPDSDKPPRKKFYSFETAKEVQGIMTRKYGHKFYIMQAVNETQPSNNFNTEKEVDMQKVKLLYVDNKVIEVSDEQAELLGAKGHSYEVKSALRYGDTYFEAQQLEVTTKEEKKTNAVEDAIRTIKEELAE